MRSDMEKELRRRQSILSTTGLGVIAFGLWSFLKFNLYFLLAGDTLYGDMEFDPVLDRKVIIALAYVVCMIIALIILLIHVKVGRNAIAEAKDGQKKYRYVGVCIAMIVFNIASITMTLFMLDLRSASFPDYIASIIVDTTLTIMLIELVAAARKVRYMRQELQK